MIFRTENSVYEVRPDQRRFRRVARDSRGRVVPVSAWQPYEHLGTVAIGERVRFFLPAEAPTSSVVAWTTTPVRELLATV